MKHLIFILIAFSLFSQACKQDETKGKDNTVPALNDSCVSLTDPQLKNTGVKTDTLKFSAITSELVLSGIVEAPPQNIVSVSIPLGGYIQSSDLLPGMKIKKGQVIATVQDQTYIDLQKEYLGQVISLSNAETEFKRQKELNDSKATSDKLFQQARTEYELLKTSVKALYEKLKLAGISPETLNGDNISRLVKVVSPIDGYVSKVNVNTGKYVSPADVVFELVNPEDIHLKLRVYEKDLADISVGQKAIASLSGNNKQYECEIILISQVVDDDRSAEIHCHFKQYDPALLPGMFMMAKVESLSEEGLCVDNKALVNHSGQDYIFIANGKSFCMKKVDAYKSNSTHSLIRNTSLHAGHLVVTAGAHTLLSQLKNRDEE